MERLAIVFLTLYGGIAAFQKGMVFEQGIFLFIGEIICIVMLCWIRHWKRLDNHLKCLLRLVIFMQAIGFFFQFQCNFQKSGNQMREILWDSTINIIAGSTVYFILKLGREKLILWIGKISVVFVPGALLFSRIFSKPVFGSYIRLVGTFGLLTFGIVLFLWPFASMYLLGRKNSSNMYQRFYAMPKNQFLYLIETIIVIALACVNNDFGTAMTVGATSVILLLTYGRDWICRLIFCILGSISVLGACLISKKLKYRFIVCFFLKDCIELGKENQYLARQSESLLYLMKNIKRWGAFGGGFDCIPHSIFPNLDTDFVVCGMLIQQGIWMVLCLSGITLVFLLLMLKIDPLSKVENRLSFMITLVFAVNMVWIIFSNMTVLPICGLSFPWISKGTSTNIAFSLLLSVFIFIGRQENRAVLN